jgi:hypothetical protein
MACNSEDIDMDNLSGIALFVLHIMVKIIVKK